MMEFGATVQPRDLVEETAAPVATRPLDGGLLFADFGQAAFGTVLLPPPRDPAPTRVVVHLGEKLDAAGRVDREPPGCVRYCRIEQAVEDPAAPVRIRIPADERNTGPAAIIAFLHTA